MALILLTACVSVTALALPNPTYSLPPREVPPNLGLKLGTPFVNLDFTEYKKVDCDGEPEAVFDGQYCRFAGYQMRSYHLNRTLKVGETLDFYAGLGTDVEVNRTYDHTWNGHSTKSCLLYDVTAGVNTTERDVGFHVSDHTPNGRYVGYHTLNENERCANI